MLVAPYPHSYNSDAPLAEFIFCSIEKGLTADHHQQAPSVRACVQLDFEQSFGASHCNEHGIIYAISSDFGDRMTTQHLD